MSELFGVGGHEPIVASAQRVDGIDDAVSLDRTITHGCALLEGGRVACWGDNQDGQLGDGTLEARLSARVVEGLPPVAKVVVSVGASCALDLDGRVWCWGLNLLAAGGCEEMDALEPCPTPQAPAALPRPVVQLAAGAEHFCALDARGTVVCWGNNFGWPLARDDVSESARPLRIPLPGRAVDVAGRHWRSCARLESCEVYCWGVASWSAEVDSTGGRGLVPPARLSVRGDPSAGSELEAMARWLELGFGHACAALEDDRFTCWGDNIHGQIGNGRITLNELPSATPLAVTEVVPLHESTCARDVSGAVYCWGFAGNGLMGEGYPRTRARPIRVSTELPPVRGLASAEYSDGFGAVTEDGRVFTWGTPFPDEMDPRVVDWEARARSSHPLEWSYLRGARLLSLGHHYGCIATSDSVRCFGENDAGQLGVPGAAPGADETVTAITGAVSGLDAGGAHACVIREGGELVCWGDSSHGQLGRFPGTSTPGPTAPAIEDAVQVATGVEVTCVVRASGRVTCFGENRFGALGRGWLPEFGDETFEWRPRSALEIDDAVAIDAYGQRVCTVRASGALYCWGANGDGLLDPATSATSEPTPVPIPGITDAVAVSLGASHACVVTRGGRVMCWGENDFGQLGDGTYVSRARPVIVEGLDEVEEVRVSQAATCARRRDGSVWCWGRDIDGELGLGSELVVTTPRRVPLPE